MIEEQLYRETLLEIFRNPKNRGEIKDPDLEARLVNPLCGDEIKLQLQLEVSRRERPVGKIIKKVGFSGNGCAISQASASILASYIEGKNIEEIRKLDAAKVLSLVGITPSPARLNCVLLSWEVLKKALKNVLK